MDICAALKDLHALGIIHRDIKPSNLVRKDISVGKRSSTGVKSSSRRHHQRKSPPQFIASDNSVNLNVGSHEISLSAPLTEELEFNAESENHLLSNKSFYSSFRSLSKYFGANGNSKAGAAVSLASQNICDTFGSSSTERSRTSATVPRHGTVTASSDLHLADGMQGATLQSCYSDEVRGIISSANLTHDVASRVPSVEKHAKQYSYILIDLGSAIGKQEAAEDAGANLSLVLQTFSDNAFVGTPAYASPEAFIQQASSKMHSVQ